MAEVDLDERIAVGLRAATAPPVPVDRAQVAAILAGRAVPRHHQRVQGRLHPAHRTLQHADADHLQRIGGEGHQELGEREAEAGS